MFGRKKKIEEFERRIEALESKVFELIKLDKRNEQSNLGEKEAEAVPLAQVMDEWLNGKKEGAR